MKVRNFFFPVVLFFSAAPSWADVSRPGLADEPTVVRAAAFVIDVDSVDNADQNFTANVYLDVRWHDPRLAHGNSGIVSYPLTEVWHPRIAIVNRQRVMLSFPERVEVSPDGEVVYRQRVWGQFSQPLDLRQFPFDSQQFSILIATAGYHPDEISLVQNPDLKSGIADKISLADWRIQEWSAEPSSYQPATGTRENAGFLFTIRAKREAGYYLIKVIIPLIMVVAMSWVVFWIDPKQYGTQIGVAATAMLTLIAYRFAVGGDVPKIPYLTRMDYFILVSTLLVFASLLEVVITATLSQKDRLSLARRIDNVCRIAFPALFGLIAIQAFVL